MRSVPGAGVKHNYLDFNPDRPGIVPIGDTIDVRVIAAEDIPLIAYHPSLFCSKLGSDRKKLTEETIRFLVSLQRKGNARELQNEIKRAVIFSKSDLLVPGDFGNSAELATSARKGWIAFLLD